MVKKRFACVKKKNPKPFLTFEDRIPVQDGTAHKDHTVSGDSSRRGIVNVVHLKDDLTVGSHWNTVTIGQS